MAMIDCNESENNFPGPPCTDPNPNSAARFSPSPPPPKRSRRSVEKRVESIPIQETTGEVSRARGVSECSPPADSWAWRKYGQKPIKGSPYPRGYYRCSSSKGCPARKQVERSRVDPTTLLVTYTCDHNHAYPLPKNHSIKSDPDPDPIASSPQPESAPDPEESRFSDLIGEDDNGSLDFWGPTSSTSSPSDTLLYGPIFVGADDVSEMIGEFKEEEEDALFAGLGELPEYSTVFRRSYFERPVALHTAVHQ